MAISVYMCSALLAPLHIKLEDGDLRVAQLSHDGTQRFYWYGDSFLRRVLDTLADLFRYPVRRELNDGVLLPVVGVQVQLAVLSSSSCRSV